MKDINKEILEWFKKHRPNEWEILDSIRGASTDMEILCEMAVQWYYYACVIFASPPLINEFESIEAVQDVLRGLIKDKIRLPFDVN